MKNNKQQYTFIDLFAGLGGFHLALQQLGCKCVFASEIKDDLRKLYALNFPETPIYGDITKINPEDKGLPVEQRRPHPRYPNRAKDRDDGKKFFMEFVKSDIEKIAIENPVGIMSTCYRKPDQIVQPFMFGHEARKATCLWLKGLPKLTPTNIVGEGEIAITKSGKKMSKWYYDAISLPKEERQRLRSKTFQGIADAMADQWG
jgi:hypothetical protein